MELSISKTVIKFYKENIIGPFIKQFGFYVRLGLGLNVKIENFFYEK